MLSKTGKTLISTLVLLTGISIVPVSAQWEGSVKADGGWNFQRSNKENADLKLKYSNEKFHIGANLYFGRSFLPENKVTSILDAKKEQNEYYKGENKKTDSEKYSAGAKLDFGLNFNQQNTLNLNLGYGISGTDKYSDQYTERYNNSDRATLSGTQIDTTYDEKCTIDGKVSYSHKFLSRPDARLDVTLSEVIGLSTNLNRRITSGNFYPDPKNYATMKSLNNFNTRLSVSYDDIFNFSGSRLQFRGGIDLVASQDLDGYAAKTLVNGVWRDSSQYKQSYFYDSETLEPYVNLSYSVGKFDFFLKERFQVYWHGLLDKLDEKKSSDPIVNLFDTYDNRNLLSAGLSYRINESHKLILDYSRTISRPDYKKLCPSLMIGESEGEYFIGNPKLRPETSDKINLGYSYTKNIFVLRFDLNYRIKKDTAEKVIDVHKDITDPMVRTLFTWINNKRQNTFGSRLGFKMNGRDVKAEIWAGTNYDVYGNNEKFNKEDFNYEIGTAIEVLLNETTKLSSSLAYISEKESAYNLKGEDVIANLRFSKVLAKGLDLYLEFNDIVDKDIYEETWNADKNYLKVTTTSPMQRAAIIGISYIF